MNNIKINPCPHCGGERIDIKTEVITRYEIGNDNVKVWAFCRNCGHRGLSEFGRFSEEEGREAAIRKWNVYYGKPKN